MAKDRYEIPKMLRGRLRDVAAAHALGTADQAAAHFIERGLEKLAPPPGALGERLQRAVDDQGYSSEAELIEHLLLRGLRAYEEPAETPEALKARLRGLGYID